MYGPLLSPGGIPTARAKCLHASHAAAEPFAFLRNTEIIYIAIYTYRVASSHISYHLDLSRTRRARGPDGKRSVHTVNQTLGHELGYKRNFHVSAVAVSGLSAAALASGK